jgi:hypothetical protein
MQLKDGGDKYMFGLTLLAVSFLVAWLVLWRTHNAALSMIIFALPQAWNITTYVLGLEHWYSLWVSVLLICFASLVLMSNLTMDKNLE